MPHERMIDLSGLNEQQLQAVTHREGPLLVLAGAGSGKTRVISHRIAWLIGEAGVDPSSILAVTFTNKAAGEMLSRVFRLLPHVNSKPTVGTFHSTSLRMLRGYADRLGYTKSFVVYDTADQLTLVRRALRETQTSEETFTPRMVLSHISRAKNELIRPAEYERTHTDFVGSKIAQLYHLYQRRLKEFDAMDFDDLIGNYVYLLEKHDDIREKINSRFQHLLIDEYQDTNRAQYVLIKLLAGKARNVVAVGDEDQSIYKFRGANIQNILGFERDFPGARIVKLEQNYRSTGNILDAATGVVEKNLARNGMKLFTDRGVGDPVRIVSCESEREEAKFVVDRILEMRESIPLREVAVLFRTNAQSRPFEEDLLHANIPYTVVGGVKFYERAEIKDVLAYTRLSIRPHDTPSIERVINVPARGIGDTTVKALTAEAEAKGVTLWEVIEGDLPFVAERARKAVREFREIVRDLQRATTSSLPELFDYLLLRTGYRRMLAESNDPQDESRLENIGELVNSVREFHEANTSAPLSEYLDSVTLLADVDQYDDQKGVTLMTLHSAKGLEFRVVFLAGMEEGILPHAQSRTETVDDLEEERRLCYVGMTRAKERLYCIHCHQRRIHGQLREQSPSPFLEEIPLEVREEVRLSSPRASASSPSWRERPISASRHEAPRSSGRGATNVVSFFSGSAVAFDPKAIRTASTSEPRSKELTRGARVRHEQFGDGVILRIEGSGTEAKLTVYFDRAGTKKFIAKYAKLTRV